MISGGTNPPRPPAAPTTPVTEPTLSAGATLPTSANTAPLAAPRIAAMPRKAIVASGISGGWNAWTTANPAVTPKHQTRTDTGGNRSDSHPPRHPAGAPDAPDEDGRGVDPVGQQAADRPGGHGEHDETGGPQRGVVGRQLVRGAQIGREVDAERDESAEADRVQE